MASLGMFSEVINSIMFQRNLSQKQVAHLSGIHKSSVSRYVTGVLEPKYSDIVKIADGIGLTSADMLLMFNGVDTKFKPIFTNNYILRPLLEDKVARVFSFYLYVINDLVYTPPKDSYGKNMFFFVHEGRLKYNGKIYEVGENLHTAPEDYKLQLYSDSKHLVIVSLDKQKDITMENVSAHYSCYTSEFNPYED